MPKSVTKANLLSEIARLSSLVGKFEREHKALSPLMRPAHQAAIDSLKLQIEECSRKVRNLGHRM
jgi:hypothetical protein